jgi:type II secretory pathway component GspD/PulD (secretin)
MSVAVGIALAPLALYGQGPVLPAGTTEQALSRPSRVHDALRAAMDAYRRGDYELAATLFQQAQAGKDDLTPLEQRDLVTWLRLNGTALQARREGANQIRRAEEAMRQGRTQEAHMLLKSIAPNQQFLTPADKLHLQRLREKLMPGQTAMAPTTPGGSLSAVIQARSKLNQARLLMAHGNYDAAQALAREAERLHAPLLPGEDTPQKVLDDIARARIASRSGTAPMGSAGKTTRVVDATPPPAPNDPKALLAAARAAYNRGQLDEAERLAKQADQAGTFWGSMTHFWGDSPSKVLRDVAAARTRMAEMAQATKSSASTPAAKDSATKDSSTSFTALKAFIAKTDNSVAAAPDKSQQPAPDNTQKARELLKQARQALDKGNVAQARQLADQARALKPGLNSWEDTPDKVLAAVRETEAKKKPPKGIAVVADHNSSSDPRQLLKQARELYNAGKLEEAQTLAQKANAQPTHWGLFEDSPDKLMQDVRKARLKRDQEEAGHVLVEARKLYEQGNLAEAERLAHRAERLHGPYSIWDLGDRPQKLLAEIDVAKAKNLKPSIPTPPSAVAKKEAEKKASEVAKKDAIKKEAAQPAVAQNNLPPPVWPEAKNSATNRVQQVTANNTRLSPFMPTPPPAPANGVDKKLQARTLLAEARRLQKEGRLLEARRKALEAQRLGASYGPDDDRPELVLLALSALCQKRIETLVQQAGDWAAAANGDPKRYERAESDLRQARQLALGFHLDTQLIDSKAAWIQHMRDKALPPTPAAAQPQISQMHHQEPAAPVVATGQQHGVELLQQARMELRAGQTGNARRLAEAAFSGPYGVQDEAAQVLRSIDAEEFNQRVLAANHTFEAAVEAVHRREYSQATLMLRSIDPHLLTDDKQAQLREIMLTPGMQSTAVVQAGVRQNATDQPGPAMATSGERSALRASRSTPPESDFAKQVEAMQEVKFQKLRADGLHTQSEAMRLFQAGETDHALEILQDYNAGLRDSGLDAAKVALLQRPIDNRLHQLKTLKHQRDFEKLQASQHDAAAQNLTRLAAQEQAKKDQVAELMKKYNTFFKEGKYKEAEMYAMQAKELDPDDPVAAAAIYTARIQGNSVQYKDAKKRREDLFVHSLNYAEDPGPEVDSLHPLAIDPAITMQNKGRKPIDVTSLAKIKNEQERKIYRRLEAPVSSLDYKDTPLKQILDDLQVTTAINIVPDEPALNDAGISLDKPVTMRLEGVSLKSALNLLLHQAHLTYVVADEVLKVTTEDQAHGRLEIRTYSVADLILPVLDANDRRSRSVNGPNGLFPAQNPNLLLNNATPYISLNSMAGPSTPISQEQSSPGLAASTSPGTPAIRKENPKGTLQEELIRLIMSTIAPTTWRDVGGQGTIEYYPLGMALVIAQTPDIQEQVADLLAALRRLEDQQVAIEVRFITIAENFYERIGVDFNINIRNNQSKYETQIVSQQFKPFGFINSFTPQNFVTGLTPAGSFTQDLNIPIKTSSYEMAVPPFGAYPNIPGANGGISMGLAFLSDIEVYMFLEAAQGDQRTNVMQAPKLTMYNGQVATIMVSDMQFFVTSVTVAQLGGQVVFVPNNTPIPTGGIDLTLNPVISADRRFVRLSLTPTITNITTANVQLFPITTFITPVFEGGAVGQPVPFTQFLQQPVINTISVMTTVNVPDGGTVLIGGMKRLSEGRNEFGPPILSKIPYIDRLFKNVGYGRETESLLMMVTPRIIILEEEEQRQVLGTAAPVPGAPGP